MLNTILRLLSVLGTRGKSRSAHSLDIQQGLFTRPMPIGARAVGWPPDEVAALNTTCTAGKTNEEIRALIVNLEAARQTGA